MFLIKNIKKEYNFGKFFKFYLDVYNNVIVLCCKTSFYVLKIPSHFFFKKNNNNYFFIFLKKKFFITFLKHIFNFYNIFFSLYFFNLKLKGLGYRVFIVSNKLIKIFLNRSNFYYLHIPNNVLLKYKTRYFFFLSTNYNFLKLLILNLLLLKEFVIYRISGIYYSRQIILVKPGKNKFR